MKAMSAEKWKRDETTYFPELPDSHVLRGLYLEAKPEAGSAQEAFQEALERGLPAYRDGLAHLDTAIRRWDITHRGTQLLTEMLSAVPVGSLWTVSPRSGLTFDRITPRSAGLAAG
jgi:hypothetical protein